MTQFEEWPVREIFRIVSLCSVWYATSATGNVVVKILLTEFPYPMTITIVQLFIMVICLPAILKCLKIPVFTTPHGVNTPIPWDYYVKMIFPLALGKFVTSLSAHFSLLKVPVSYAHTVKATMPLFTVILSRIIMKEKQTWKVYSSILPIVLGVIIATMTEQYFHLTGLLSALAATIGFSFMNIFSKKALLETNLHHLRLLLTLCRLSLALFIPVWLYVDVVDILHDNSPAIHPDRILWTLSLLVIDGFAMLGQNVVAFTVLALVTPLSYAIANATKRIVVIAFSLVMLRNPVSLTNILGMVIAVFGVLAYNKAKLDQSRKRRADTLPFVRSESNLSRHAGTSRNLHLTPLQRTHTDFNLQNHVTLYPDSVDEPAPITFYPQILPVNRAEGRLP